MSTAERLSQGLAALCALAARTTGGTIELRETSLLSCVHVYLTGVVIGDLDRERLLRFGWGIGEVCGELAWARFVYVADDQEDDDLPYEQVGKGRL